VFFEERNGDGSSSCQYEVFVTWRELTGAATNVAFLSKTSPLQRSLRRLTYENYV
jgi:hypothetical protein